MAGTQRTNGSVDHARPLQEFPKWYLPAEKNLPEGTLFILNNDPVDHQEARPPALVPPLGTEAERVVKGRSAAALTLSDEISGTWTDAANPATRLKIGGDGSFEITNGEAGAVKQMGCFIVPPGRLLVFNEERMRLIAMEIVGSGVKMSFSRDDAAFIGYEVTGRELKLKFPDGAELLFIREEKK